MSSISIAEVYYKRPLERKNTAPRYERANGYNPYWDVRLSAIPTSDRLLASAMRPQGSSTSTPGAGGDGSLNRYPDSAENGDGTTNQNVSTSDSPLASAFGEPGFSLQNYPTVNFDSVDETIFAYAPANLNQLSDAIEEELTEVLRTAFENMLSNALDSSGINSSIADAEGRLDELEEATMGQLGDLANDAANSPFGTALAEATQIADELTQEFNDLRDHVLDLFPIMVDDVEAEIASEVAAVRTLINEKRESLIGLSDSDNAQNRIYQEIWALEQDIVDIRETYKDRLIRGLMEIVNNATDAFEMRYPEASYLVNEWLRDPTDDLEVPWAIGDDG